VKHQAASAACWAEFLNQSNQCCSVLHRLVCIHLPFLSCQLGCASCQPDSAAQTLSTTPSTIVAAVAGGSYGGYAALAGLAFTPNLYKCGVDMYGISNVATTMKAMPPYWGVIRFRFYKRIGDAVSNVTFNRQISPLFHVDRIQAPLMIGQGANDPRVIKPEADQIYKAVKQRHPKMDVQYVLYPDEGHGWVRPPNRLDWSLRMEKFYARHLGGREGPDLKVQGSSARVITKV
jgi:dienelactone hydrolase